MNKSLYLSLTIDNKQLGLFDTSDNALAVKNANKAQIWDYDEKTGQYYPTNGSVCKFDILPKKDSGDEIDDN